MSRLILLAVVGALLCFAPAPVAHAQADALPAIDGSGLSGPLRPDQLTPEERVRYDALPAGSDQARQFLYTRGFLRYCRLVIAGSLEPRNLPGLPEQENYDRQFLTDEESITVNNALSRYLLASADRPPGQSRPATDTLPAVTNRVMSPLTVAQLDAAERATYATLAPDLAQQFLYTRGYLRFCRMVVDDTLPPQQLPDVPEYGKWNRQFLSAEERVIVDRAVRLHLLAAP